MNRETDILELSAQQIRFPEFKAKWNFENIQKSKEYLCWIQTVEGIYGG